MLHVRDVAVQTPCPPYLLLSEQLYVSSLQSIFDLNLLCYSAASNYLYHIFPKDITDKALSISHNFNSCSILSKKFLSENSALTFKQ